jgi:DNA-binding IclR family transcriptional regulator
MTDYQDPCGTSEPGVQPALKKEKSDYIIRKVIHALDILEQFHDDVAELSLKELSKRLSMNESNVQLLLTTLKSRNYLEQSGANNSYRLGFKNLELAQAVLRKIDLYRVSHPVLASICSACGENTAVAVLRKSHVIELDSIHSEQPVHVVTRIGAHFPVHCTAAGKVLIASKTPHELEGLLRTTGLTRYTDQTITDVDALRRQLREIARNGFAVEDREMDNEVSGVAAAIHDHIGLVVGAVVITGPACRVSLGRLNGELADLARQGAAEISAHLGFSLAESRSTRDLSDSCAAPETPKIKRLRSAARKLQSVETPRAA